MALGNMPDDGGFGEFWRHYPRKVAKAEARKAWARMLPPVDKILEALKWQKGQEQWQRDGGQFIPYPASYLRGERWEDSPEVEIEAPKVERPSITCIVCRKKSFMWTDGKCDPCWRASQGLRQA